MSGILVFVGILYYNGNTEVYNENCVEIQSYN